MLELLQFRFSPYNEKVRWALDLKCVPHRRTALLPGPHMPRVKKSTGGLSTTTPVLVLDEAHASPGMRALINSNAIIEWLEQHYPAPPLLPAEMAQASAARALAARFDDDFAPRGRRAVLAALLSSPSAFAGVFGCGHPWLAQKAYALTVPLAAPLVRKGNAITGEASVQDGLAAFEAGLDLVAREAAATGYLVGSTFTLADLTAASVLATCVDPPDSPMARPRPTAPRLQQLVDRFARHPGADWVRGIYARHRGAKTDFNGPSNYAAS